VKRNSKILPISYEPTVGSELQRIKTDHWEICLQEVGYALRENWRLYFKKASYLIFLISGESERVFRDGISEYKNFASEVTTPVPTLFLINKSDILFQSREHVLSLLDSNGIEETELVSIAFSSTYIFNGLSDAIQWMDLIISLKEHTKLQQSQREM